VVLSLAELTRSVETNRVVFFAPRLVVSVPNKHVFFLFLEMFQGSEMTHGLSKLHEEGGLHL
jgi:hypothetical protein